MVDTGEIDHAAISRQKLLRQDEIHPGRGVSSDPLRPDRHVLVCGAGTWQVGRKLEGLGDAETIGHRELEPGEAILPILAAHLFQFDDLKVPILA